MPEGETSDRRMPHGGCVSVGTDITEKKTAEKLLEVRLAAIEASLDGIAILDREGHYSYLNRSYATLHGYDSTTQLIGQSWHTHYAEDEQKRFEQSVFPRLYQTRSWRGEATGRRCDGTTFPQELSLTCLEEEGLVCVVRDATESRRADQERARLLEQFHFAQRSQVLGRLAGGVAHDFNNILGIINGFAELACSELGDCHPVKARLEKILAAGRRAKDLVRQILDYSRQSGSDRRPLRMDLLVEETSSLLRATLPATIRLSKFIDQTGAFVKADASQIDQILMNLCVNAMHAIGNRPASIALRVEDCQIDGPVAADSTAILIEPSAAPMKIGKGCSGAASRIWVGEFTMGRYVRLSVKDDGCGMDAATLMRIFDPFFTTKPAGVGTGLGLAAVLGIVTDHNGMICVETEVGVGTTFEVYLPICEAVETVEPAPIRRAPKAECPATILVVDDETQLAAITCDILRGLGYSAVSCTSAPAALSIIRADPHAVDLIITDQTMPGMTGDELAQNIRMVRPDLPVILCTGFNARLSEARLAEIGAKALLLKPVPSDDLAAAVAAVLRPAA